MNEASGRTPRALRAAKRGQQREKKERKRQRLAGNSNGAATPDAKYASPASSHGSPDLVGFADPTTYGSPPVSAVPVGDVSNSEAFAAAVATGDDGADLTTLRPSRHQRNTWGMLVRRAMRSTSRGRLPSILVSLVLATMQTTCSPPEKHQKVRHTKRQYRLQQQSSTAI